MPFASYATPLNVNTSEFVDTAYMVRASSLLDGNGCIIVFDSVSAFVPLQAQNPLYGGTPIEFALISAFMVVDCPTSNTFPGVKMPLAGPADNVPAKESWRSSNPAMTARNGASLLI
jgi:hypothetical protein